MLINKEFMSLETTSLPINNLILSFLVNRPEDQSLTALSNSTLKAQARVITNIRTVAKIFSKVGAREIDILRTNCDQNVKALKDLNLHIQENSPWKPLCLFAFSSSHERVLILLKNDFDVNQQNTNSRRTALHYASSSNDEVLVKILLSHPNINPNVKNKDNKIATQLAKTVHIKNLIESKMNKDEKIEN